MFEIYGEYLRSSPDHVILILNGTQRNENHQMADREENKNWSGLLEDRITTNNDSHSLANR